MGPLINPAKPRIMIVGVNSFDVGSMMVQVLQLSHVTRAWVVYGLIGLDEVKLIISS